MTGDEALFYKNRARAYAFKILRDADLADDVAHDVLILRLEYELKHGEPSKQWFKYSVIEVLRARYGRTGTKRGEFARAQRFAASIDEPAFDDSDTPLEQRLLTDANDPRAIQSAGENTAVSENMLDEIDDAPAFLSNANRTRWALWSFYKTYGMPDDGFEIEWICL